MEYVDNKSLSIDELVPLLREMKYPDSAIVEVDADGGFRFKNLHGYSAD
jgi:hypothetical protein